MIFFGDVSPAVEAALVGLAVAAIVNPAVLLVAQARQFGHERKRWQHEKDAQREAALLGRRMEVMDEFRSHVSVVLRTTNRWQRAFRYGDLVATDHDGAGERRAASGTIIDAIEGARATISRVSLFYGARSAAALAAVGTLEAALAAQDALQRVFIQVADIERPPQPSERWTPERIASVRDEQQTALTELDATLDEKVMALGAAMTALVDAARGDDAASASAGDAQTNTPGQGHPAPRADYAGPCRREKRSAKRARGACAVMTRRCICTSIRRRGRSSCPRGGRAAEIYLARARLAGWRSSRGSVSRSHGVAVSMGDPPLGVLASVHLSYAQCGCPPLAINGGGDVLESCGLRHVADHVVRDHLDGK